MSQWNQDVIFCLTSTTRKYLVCVGWNRPNVPYVAYELARVACKAVDGCRCYTRICFLLKLSIKARVDFVVWACAAGLSVAL